MWEEGGYWGEGTHWVPHNVDCILCILVKLVKKG